MKKILRNPEFLVLGLIILTAICLRFYNYSNWSLSNDELSALNRSHFSTVGEVIQKGVKEMDTHPAGVQVFIYYWTKVFGTSEKAYRLPFVLAGILSVLLSYLIFSKWFNKTAGLFIALTMSFLSYFILYSQLARPYSFGLLFTLATVYFWTRILIDKKESTYWHYVGFALFTALSAYTHYFSLFLVLIVDITGLIFLKKHNAIKYILSCVLAILLFLPHLNITLYQMSHGMDNVAWIPVPESNWIWNFLNYAFNGSATLQITILIIVLSFIILYNKHIKWNKLRIVSLSWFLIVYFTGYFYSIYKSPMLQYSVLLFSFPFLLAFIFSILPDKLDWFIYLKMFALLIIGLYTTVFEQRFYSTQQFGVFKELAETSHKWQEIYRDDNITRMTNVISPFYIQYYCHKYPEPLKYSIYSMRDMKDLNKLTALIEKTKTPYFEYSWSTVANLPVTEQIIRTKYNQLVEKNDYFNSGIRLYKRNPDYKRPLIYQSILSFDTLLPEWNYNSFTDKKPVSHSDSLCFEILPEQDYGGFIFEKKYKELNPTNDTCIINASAYIYSEDSLLDGDLVFEVRRADSVIYWNSAQIRNYYHQEKWSLIMVSRFIYNSDKAWVLNIKPNDFIRIYFWNSYKKHLFIDDVKIDIYPYQSTYSDNF